MGTRKDMMNAAIVAVGAWFIALPSVLAVGIKSTPEGKVSFRTDSEDPLKFRLQNSQVPFYNNVLGYALGLKDDNLYITSGLFQTLWKCDMATTGDKQLKTQSDTPFCTRLETKDHGNFYKGTEANVDTTTNTSVDNFNIAIKGTAASWNYKNLEYGFGWGRSVAVNPVSGNDVAVGCPGCTGSSLLKGSDGIAAAPENPKDAKRLSGLVFEYASGATIPSVKDTSLTTPDEFGYGNFAYESFPGDFPTSPKNIDFNCVNSKSGCSLGTAVKYQNGKLIATRSRSSRNLARQQGLLVDADAVGNRCASQLGFELVGFGYCQMDNSVHFAIGDALDITNLNPSDFGTDGTTSYTLKGWGYNKVVTSANVFAKIDEPVQSPYHSRFGQAVETGVFFKEKGTENDIAYGAPGYGSYGAVFVYAASEGLRPVDATGLRTQSREPTFRINGPDKDTVQTNFGYSLRAFDVEKDDTNTRRHLAVGAPTYATTDYRGGAVFTYKGSELPEFTLRNVLRPKRSDISVSGRFGSAITSLDLDDDKVDEIIVGAPFNQVGCTQFPGQSYCGALFIFSGSTLIGNENIVFPAQKVVGQQIFAMLGHAVIANDKYVFASAPGVFGERDKFSTSLLKGLETVTLDWPMNPQVQQFQKLQVIDYTTQFDEVTADNDVANSGGVRTVPINDFQNVNQGFNVSFILSADTPSNFTVVYPEIYSSDKYVVTIIIDGVSTIEAAQYAYNGSQIIVKIQISRVTVYDPDVEPEKLAEADIFNVTQLIDEVNNVAKEGSLVSANVAVRVADPSPSILEVKITLAEPDDGNVKLGEAVKSMVTITNRRDTTDSLIVLNIQLKNVFKGNILDYSTIRETTVDGETQDVTTWPFFTLSANSTDDFPASLFSKRVKSIAAGASIEIPLDFILKDVFQPTLGNYNDVEITATAEGTESSVADTVALVVDDTCDVAIEGSIRLPQGLTGVLQGGRFTLVHTVTPQPGKAFTPKLETDLGFAVEPSASLFAAGCSTREYYGKLCNETYDNSDSLNKKIIPLVPWTYVRDDSFQPIFLEQNDSIPLGCYWMPGLLMQCNATSQMLFDSAPIVFDNKLAVRDDLFGIDAVRKETILLNTTYSGDIQCGSNVYSATFDVISSSVLGDPSKLAVAWWIILVAVLGALLLAAIVSFILWKLGFFKRTKPPTDGLEDTGQLDEEVAAGSMLRG